MYDPARDDSPSAHVFAWRLVVVAVVTAVVALAMWPSISGFRSGPDGEHSCVAILDGWHAHGGSCVDSARHRLWLSAALLAVVVVLALSVGTAVAWGERRNGRRNAAIGGSGTLPVG